MAYTLHSFVMSNVALLKVNRERSVLHARVRSCVSNLGLLHNGTRISYVCSPTYFCWCCDRKSRAAYVQSFAPWQQATIEFTCHDHSLRTLLLRSIVDIVSITRDYTPRSLYYCLFAPHVFMVLFFTHIPFVVNRTINATPPERLQHWTNVRTHVWVKRQIGFCIRSSNNQF